MGDGMETLGGNRERSFKENGKAYDMPFTREKAFVGTPASP
jgi:hypothetical protein